MDQIAKAQLFRELHLGPEILLIGNGWDAASARMFEEAGFRAVGTGSAGIAFSHGYVDNDSIPCEVILDAPREIVRAVSVRFAPRWPAAPDSGARGTASSSSRSSAASIA